MTLIAGRKIRALLACITLWLAMSSYVFGVDADAKDVAARNLVKTAGYSQRMQEVLAGYVRAIRTQTSVPEQEVKALEEALSKEDVDGALASVVKVYLLAADLEKINSFLNTEAGKKETTFMLSLFDRLRAGTLNKDAIIKERDLLIANLVPKERQEIVAFRDSPVGKRYWNLLPKIDEAIQPLFDQLSKSAIRKVTQSQKAN